MKLVLFTQRAFHGGRIVEAGEQIVVDDAVRLGAHMVDIAKATEAALKREMGIPETPLPAKLTDLIAELGGNNPTVIGPDGAEWAFDTTRCWWFAPASEPAAEEPAEPEPVLSPGMAAADGVAAEPAPEPAPEAETDAANDPAPDAPADDSPPSG